MLGVMDKILGDLMKARDLLTRRRLRLATSISSDEDVMKIRLLIETQQAIQVVDRAIDEHKKSPPTEPDAEWDQRGQ